MTKLVRQRCGSQFTGPKNCCSSITGSLNYGEPKAKSTRVSLSSLFERENDKQTSLDELYFQTFWRSDTAEILSNDGFVFID